MDPTNKEIVLEEQTENQGSGEPVAPPPVPEEPVQPSEPEVEQPAQPAEPQEVLSSPPGEEGDDSVARDGAPEAEPVQEHQLEDAPVQEPQPDDEA